MPLDICGYACDICTFCNEAIGLSKPEQTDEGEPLVSDEPPLVQDPVATEYPEDTVPVGEER